MIGSLVSVVTATYNSEDYIMEAYQSLCAQENNLWEWCVTDDASTDSTAAMLRTIAKSDQRVNIFELKENVGPGVARNFSIKRSRGRYIAFLDSDDMWEPSKLTRQLEHIKGIAFSFTGFAVTDFNGDPTGTVVDVKMSHAIGYEDLLRKKVTLGCSTVMLDMKLISEVQMPAIRRGQDYLTWLGLLRSGNDAHLLPQPLTKIRRTPGSVSANKITKALGQWKIYREHELLPVSKSLVCFAHYAYQAIKTR